MGQREKRNEEIERYVIENVREHPQDIASLVSEHFDISRQAAGRHLQRLKGKGILSASGNTRNRKYELMPIEGARLAHEIKPGMQEDKVWREDVSPVLSGLKDNVLTICQYGFTEIFNNALEHSEGKSVTTRVGLWPDIVVILVTDDGVGIFNKIQRDLHLDDPLHALLELSKGKLSTDPQHHTGEGIFFTSRALDKFVILSGRLRFVHLESGPDFMFEDTEGSSGTLVTMEISRSSTRLLKDVFDDYSVGSESFGFDRTVVPVALAKYGDEKLVSRSQARRLLARFERFREVILDFDKVEYIGQAFADEVFRVFQNEHPNVTLICLNENEEIRRMVERVRVG